MTRGQRNHNPLNIRRSKGTHWLGEAKHQTDREFVRFRCDLMGFRAAFRILRTYIQLHHLTTLKLIIYRWAPPEDGNCTASYLYTVSERSHIRQSQELTYENEDALIAIVRAMAWVESHMSNIDPNLLHQAYLLAK